MIITESIISFCKHYTEADLNDANVFFVVFPLYVSAFGLAIFFDDWSVADRFWLLVISIIDNFIFNSKLSRLLGDCSKLSAGLNNTNSINIYRNS